LWIEQRGSGFRGAASYEARRFEFDMGELPEMLANGSQEALMKFVTSANVAAAARGDEEMMQATIEQAIGMALRWGRIRAMRTGRFRRRGVATTPRRKFGIPSTGS